MVSGITSRCPVQVPLPVNHSLSQVTSRGSEYHRYPQALNLLAWIYTVKGGLKALGFSNDAMDIALLARGDSTSRQIYVLTYFLDYLSKDSISSSDILEGTVSTFSFHAKTFGRQYRTVLVTEVLCVTQYF